MSPALRKAVREGGYDAGLAADGDGDRIGAMDRDGTFITPHQIFSILLWHLAGTRNLPGDVAKTFSSTKMLDKIAAKFGRQVFEVPIGFKYICETDARARHPARRRRIRRHRHETLLAGARRHRDRAAAGRSDGLARQIVWANWWRDLHEEFGEHHYGRVDLELKPGQKERAIAYFSDAPSSGKKPLTRWLDWEIIRRENMDGIKLYLGEIGWVMVRASGTESMLRLYAETSRPGTTRRILDETAAFVQNL